MRKADLPGTNFHFTNGESITLQLGDGRGATSCYAISDADDMAVGMGNGGGRGHQRITFSLVLASGGLRHRGAYGVTDELSKTIVTDPLQLVDTHATFHAALDIDPAKELFDGSCPVPIH